MQMLELRNRDVDGPYCVAFPKM